MTRAGNWRAVLAVTGVPGFRSVVAGVELVDVTASHSLAVALQDGSDPVVVVSSDTDTAAVVTACSLLAGHRPGVAVAHATSPHAPVAVLMALAGAHRLAVDAGHGLATWRALLAESWSAVVVTSVAGVSLPNPSMAQHLRSWSPGSRFVIRQHPQPRIAAATAVTGLLHGLPRGQHDLTVSPGGTDDALTRAVLAAVSPASMGPARLPGGSARVHGRAERRQLCLVPSPVTWRPPHPGPACPSCGLSMDHGCAFCRTEAEPPPSLFADPPERARPAEGRRHALAKAGVAT